MTTLNTVLVFVDRIAGEIVEGVSKTSGKPYTYLKGGLATLQVRGKAETVRVNWFGATAELLGRGALVQADVELSAYEDKVYTQLSIRRVVPVFSNLNQALLTGRVASFKEFNKVLSVELEIAGTDRTGAPIKGIQKVTVLDKESAVAQAIKTNRGNVVLLTGALTPSKGFTDYTITSAAAVGANGGADVALATGADVDPFAADGAAPAAAPSDDLPF